MTLVVLDASVIVKWMLPGRPGEADVAAAMALFDALRGRRVEVVQPVHWLAEVAAVLGRVSPDTAREDVRDLFALELPVAADADVYDAAVELACALPHHLFDTLYHGVALATPDAVLVTADEAYYAKARGRGAIVRLRDYRVG